MTTTKKPYLPPKVYTILDINSVAVESQDKFVRIDFPKTYVWAVRPSTAVTIASSMEKSNPVGVHLADTLEFEVKVGAEDMFLVQFGDMPMRFQANQQALRRFADKLRKSASGMSQGKVK